MSTVTLLLQSTTYVDGAIGYLHQQDTWDMTMDSQWIYESMACSNLLVKLRSRYTLVVSDIYAGNGTSAIEIDALPFNP